MMSPVHQNAIKRKGLSSSRAARLFLGGTSFSQECIDYKWVEVPA
jgi:hypothetical protein